MQRRRFLATLGTSTLLAGCSDDSGPTPAESGTPPDSDEPPPTTGTPRPTRTEDATPTATPEGTATPDETATPRRVGSGETLLDVGEWYDPGVVRFVVSKVTVTTTVRLDDSDESFEMPDGDQLALATVGVENTGDTRTSVVGYRFAFIDGRRRVYGSRQTFDHPDLGTVYSAELRQVRHDDQFLADGYVLDAGERGTMWSVSILPRTVARSEVVVGYGPDGADGTLPVRWGPST